MVLCNHSKTNTLLIKLNQSIIMQFFAILALAVGLASAQANSKCVALADAVPAAAVRPL